MIRRISGYEYEFVCDVCGEHSDELYEREDDQVCLDCLLSDFPRIDENNAWEKFDKGDECDG